jgi:hypothetical protein
MLVLILGESIADCQLSLQHVASVQVSPEGAPSFETVVQAYEATMASGTSVDAEGTISIAGKGSSFVPKSSSYKVGEQGFEHVV